MTPTGKASPAKSKLTVVSKKTMAEIIERGRDDLEKFAWDWLGLEFHDGQRRFARGSTAPGIKEANLAAGNRWGKGEVIAAKVLWAAFYQQRNPDFAFDAVGRLREYKAVNVSISLDQAAIVFNKAAGYATNSKAFKHFVDRVITSPFPTMRLKPVKGLADQGAEIWARSSSHGARYLLGQNFQYLNFDECALEPNGEIILNDVIRMRMADSGGNIDTTSQPRRKNWWYRHFIRGIPDGGAYDPAVFSMHGQSFDNPWIDHEHVKRSMERMTAGQIQENIYGQFSDEETFFPPEQVARCYAGQEYKLPVPPGHDLVWKRSADGAVATAVANPHSGAIYVLGADLAAKQDKTCICVLRIDEAPWRVVHFEMLGKTMWEHVKQRVAAVHQQYGAWGYADSTGAGGPVVEDIQQNYGAAIEGYNFGGTVAQKLNVLIELQMAIQNTEVVFPYHRQLVDQLENYALEDRKLETDAVFGLALAVKAARDWVERHRVPALSTPVVPAVVLRRDRATGLVLIDDAGWDDDEDLEAALDARAARHYRHLFS